MKSLRDIGNSVLVVEHDKDMIKEADEIVDIGPLAGENGGKVIFQGTYEKLLKDSKSLTAKYLTGRQKVELISDKRKINRETGFLAIKGARENNLKNIDVKIPLKMFTCITGVSGSGKSTLVNSILYGGLRKKLEGFYEDKIGSHDSITGFENIESVALIDQSQIGKSIRSNPVTYIKAFDEIRGAATRELLTTVGVDALPHPPGGATEGATRSLATTDATTRGWFDTAARLVAEVAEALQHAHARGIVHRDVKPANLMLSRDGRICLTDFGLARVTEEPRLTVGDFLGTPAYMSPEQIRGGGADLDHRTDIYSLGAVLYELLKLQRPFVGDSREQLLVEILGKDPTRY